MRPYLGDAPDTELRAAQDAVGVAVLWSLLSLLMVRITNDTQKG
jgi:hypothetical protein